MTGNVTFNFIDNFLSNQSTTDNLTQEEKEQLAKIGITSEQDLKLFQEKMADMKAEGSMERLAIMQTLEGALLNDMLQKVGAGNEKKVGEAFINALKQLPKPCNFEDLYTTLESANASLETPEISDEQKEAKVNLTINAFISGNMTRFQAEQDLAKIEITCDSIDNNNSRVLEFTFNDKKYHIECPRTAADDGMGGNTVETVTQSKVDELVSKYGDEVKQYFKAIATVDGVAFAYSIDTSNWPEGVAQTIAALETHLSTTKENQEEKALAEFIEEIINSTTLSDETFVELLNLVMEAGCEYETTAVDVYGKTMTGIQFEFKDVEYTFWTNTYIAPLYGNQDEQPTVWNRINDLESVAYAIGDEWTQFFTPVEGGYIFNVTALKDYFGKEIAVGIKTPQDLIDAYNTKKTNDSTGNPLSKKGDIIGQDKGTIASRETIIGLKKDSIVNQEVIKNKFEPGDTVVFTSNGKSIEYTENIRKIEAAIDAINENGDIKLLLDLINKKIDGLHVSITRANTSGNTFNIEFYYGDYTNNINNIQGAEQIPGAEGETAAQTLERLREYFGEEIEGFEDYFAYHEDSNTYSLNPDALRETFGDEASRIRNLDQLKQAIKDKAQTEGNDDKGGITEPSTQEVTYTDINTANQAINTILSKYYNLLNDYYQEKGRQGNIGNEVMAAIQGSVHGKYGTGSTLKFSEADIVNAAKASIDSYMESKTRGTDDDKGGDNAPKVNEPSTEKVTYENPGKAHPAIDTIIDKYKDLLKQYYKDNCGKKDFNLTGVLKGYFHDNSDFATKILEFSEADIINKAKEIIDVIIETEKSADLNNNGSDNEEGEPVFTQADLAGIDFDVVQRYFIYNETDRTFKFNTANLAADFPDRQITTTAELKQALADKAAADAARNGSGNDVRNNVAIDEFAATFKATDNEDDIKSLIEGILYDIENGRFNADNLEDLETYGVQITITNDKNGDFVVKLAHGDSSFDIIVPKSDYNESQLLRKGYFITTGNATLDALKRYSTNREFSSYQDMVNILGSDIIGTINKNDVTVQGSYYVIKIKYQGNEYTVRLYYNLNNKAEMIKAGLADDTVTSSEKNSIINKIVTESVNTGINGQKLTNEQSTRLRNNLLQNAELVNFIGTAAEFETKTREKATAYVAEIIGEDNSKSPADAAKLALDALNTNDADYDLAVQRTINNLENDRTASGQSNTINTNYSISYNGTISFKDSYVKTMFDTLFAKLKKIVGTDIFDEQTLKALYQTAWEITYESYPANQANDISDFLGLAYLNFKSILNRIQTKPEYLDLFTGKTSGAAISAVNAAQQTTGGGYVTCDKNAKVYSDGSVHVSDDQSDANLQKAVQTLINKLKTAYPGIPESTITSMVYAAVKKAVENIGKGVTAQILNNFSISSNKTYASTIVNLASYYFQQDLYARAIYDDTLIDNTESTRAAEDDTPGTATDEEKAKWSTAADGIKKMLGIVYDSSHISGFLIANGISGNKWMTMDITSSGKMRFADDWTQKAYDNLLTEMKTKLAYFDTGLTETEFEQIYRAAWLNTYNGIDNNRSYDLSTILNKVVANIGKIMDKIKTNPEYAEIIKNGSAMMSGTTTTTTVRYDDTDINRDYGDGNVHLHDDESDKAYQKAINEFKQKLYAKYGRVLGDTLFKQLFTQAQKQAWDACINNSQDITNGLVVDDGSRHNDGWRINIDQIIELIGYKFDKLVYAKIFGYQQ